MVENLREISLVWIHRHQWSNSSVTVKESVYAVLVDNQETPGISNDNDLLKCDNCNISNK